MTGGSDRASPFDPSAGPGPLGHPGFTPPPRVIRADASALSQALVYAAYAVAFVAIAVRFDDPMIVVLAAAALALGIAVGVGIDLSRLFAAVPGGVLAIVTVLLLTLAWIVTQTQDLDVPYPVVLLVGLLVLGADWRWVERLRPSVVFSGLGLAPLLEADLAAALLASLVWFLVAAAALWSLQRDVRRSLPAPTPLGGATSRPVDPYGRDVLFAVVGSLLLAAVVTALVAPISIDLNPPSATPSLPNPPTGLGPRPPVPPNGSSDPSEPGSGGSGSGSGRSEPGSGTGSSSGSGSGSGTGPRSRSGGVVDGNGDGVIDGTEGFALVDVNGDGIINARDIDRSPIDVNGDGVIDQADGYAFLDRNGDGVIDGRDTAEPIDRDGDGVVDQPGQIRPSDRNGDGIIDRNDVPIFADTNGDGVIDRRDVVVVEDLDGDGTIGPGDVGRAADRNGDGRVDARDDLEIIDANGDGAVDDGELLDTIDRNSDGAISRDEALILDEDGDGRLSTDEIGQLPLSGDLGRTLEERRRDIDGESLWRSVLIGAAILGAIVLLVLGIVLLIRARSRHTAEGERAWALVLAERLEAEGAARGRHRARHEPVTRYAAALGGGVLDDARLADVGALISAALFSATPPPEASGVWAAQVVDEAVASHPLPTRAEARDEKRAERRRERDGDPDGDRRPAGTAAR